jgi:hypothetical protein
MPQQPVKTLHAHTALHAYDDDDDAADDDDDDDNDDDDEVKFVAGNDELDQVLRVLLGTAMFVGGFFAFFLDNTVPGKNYAVSVIYSSTYVHRGSTAGFGACWVM